MFCSCCQSAGIGRTGTYIALDALSKTGKMTGKINVTEYVKSMRTDRMNMVQTYVRKIEMYFLHQNKKMKKKDCNFVKKKKNKWKKSNKMYKQYSESSNWNVCIKSTNILLTQNIRKVFL